MPYQEITIDHTKVSADLTDFVVYVDLSDLSKAGADIFDTCQTDGGDIRVYKSDGVTQLAREVVTIDTTAKTGELHIKYAGTLSSSSDTTIQIHYDGVSTEPAAGSTYGSQNVWTTYDSVYHLDSGAGDSTSNANNGTPSNMSWQTSGNMFASDAGDFNGSTSYIDLDGTLSGNIKSDISISSWINISTGPASSGQRDQIVFYGQAGAASSPYGESVGFEIKNISSTIRLSAWVYAKTDDIYTTDTLSTSTWYYVCYSYTASSDQIDLYIGGVNKKSKSSVGVSTTATHAECQIGRSTDASNSRFFFDGIIDETRIATSVLSADLFSTEFNNQDSPSTFYSVSDELGVAQNIEETITDTVNLTESVSSGIELEVADSLSLSESQTHAIEAEVVETLSISDTISQSLSSVNIDTISLTEVIIELRSVNEEIADTLSLTESFSQILTTLITEQANLNDGFSDIDTDLETITNTISLTEQVNQIIQEVITDTVTVTELIEEIENDNDILTDSLGITEALEAMISSIQAESLSLSEQVSQVINEVIIDTVTVSEDILESINGGILVQETIQDTVNLSENISQSITSLYSDTLGITEILVGLVFITGLSFDIDYDNYTTDIDCDVYSLIVA